MIAFSIIIAALAGLVTASGHLSSLAALDASQLQAGEFWRILTGHLAHLSWRHYWVDAPAFVALYATYARRVNRSSAMLLSLFAAVSVSFAVTCAGIHDVYGGLSGVSCAAVAAILLDLVLERRRRVFPYVICGLFCYYLLFTAGLASGVRVAHEAHVAGGVSGIVFSASAMIFRNSSKHPLPLDGEERTPIPTPTLPLKGRES